MVEPPSLPYLFRQVGLVNRPLNPNLVLVARLESLSLAGDSRWADSLEIVVYLDYLVVDYFSR